jgi:hypothetical protein
MNPLYNTHNFHTTRKQFFQKKSHLNFQNTTQKTKQTNKQKNKQTNMNSFNSTTTKGTLREIIFHFNCTTNRSTRYKKDILKTFNHTEKKGLVKMILNLEKYEKYHQPTTPPLILNSTTTTDIDDSILDYNIFDLTNIQTPPIIIDLTNHDDHTQENTRTKRNRDYDTDTYQHNHKKTRLISILDLPDSFSSHITPHTP